MSSLDQTRTLLVQKFDKKHVNSALKYYSALIDAYLAQDWEGVGQQGGKFVEAITKALMVHGGRAIGDPRKFKAGVELAQMANNLPAAISDVVRIVLPKAALFIYEIASNRGGRHDAHEIDANEMDAKSLVPCASWVLAEMVRFCSAGGDIATAAALIDTLTNKKYPYFENIDGRDYINVRDLKPREIGLLLLSVVYPSRVSRQQLVTQVIRHGVSPSAANTAVHRLKGLVDDDAGMWKLRGLGRQEAEEILSRLHDQT